MPANPTRKSDFNPQDLIQTQTDLEGRVAEIEEKISTNEKFVEFFTKSISDSKKIEKTFKDAFVDIIKKDDKVRKSIKSLIQESDRHDIKMTLKKISGFIGWIVSLVITAIITAVITSLLTNNK
ncbi:MAG: hypothetical protein Q4A21_02205 [bacterium]|nr:hypothetical protein [bacterium]